MWMPLVVSNVHFHAVLGLNRAEAGSLFRLERGEPNSTGVGEGGFF